MAQADTRVLAGGTLGFELPLRMAKRAMHAPLELDVQGVSLTEFAQAICLQEQVEVSLIRLPITVWLQLAACDHRYGLDLVAFRPGLCE